jgi:uncharacterized metal-binding protein
MSNGRVHAVASVALASGFLIGGGGEPAIGALVGIMLSPDLDVDNGFSADRYIRNSVGHVFETGWDIVWWPYRKAMKHGSFASHFPLVGTAGRIVYLWLIMVAVYLILSVFFPLMDIMYELTWWLEHVRARYPMLMGLAGSDLIHYVLDKLTTESSE